MTAHHNHWDTSATRDEMSRNISSTTTTTENPEVAQQLEMMNETNMLIQNARLVVVPIPLPSVRSSMATLKRPLMLLR
ncbi:hypothetical protein Tco_0914930, partial [Tanacetum coccineum]